MAFVVSLTKWEWSDGMVLTMVALTMSIASLLPGPINGPPQFRMMYASASKDAQTAAAIAAAASGSVSAPSKLVVPAAQREWVYLFPNPFACRVDQFAHFARSGPAPSVVIAAAGWEELVSPADLDSIVHTLETDYAVMDRIGQYVVWGLLSGASPSLVDECEVVAVE